MASSKNYTEVLIGGKVFTLSGFESEDYLQKVSTYLNHKIEECTSSDGYRKQSGTGSVFKRILRDQFRRQFKIKICYIHFSISCLASLSKSSMPLSQNREEKSMRRAGIWGKSVIICKRLGQQPGNKKYILLF